MPELAGGEEGVLGDTLVYVRLEGAHRVVRVAELAKLIEAGYAVDVYGIDSSLVDGFYRVRRVEERVCESTLEVHARGHGSIALCSSHRVPIVGATGGLEEKPAAELEPGDFIVSFVRRESRRGGSGRASGILVETEEDDLLCSARVEDLALSLWSLRISGVLSSIASNRFCLRVYSESERARVEKIPIAPFRALADLLRSASRRSKSSKHILVHLGVRKAVSKSIACSAIRDLQIQAHAITASHEQNSVLGNISRLLSSNLYGVKVSHVEKRGSPRESRAYTIEAEEARFVFVGVAPLLVS